MKTYPHRPRRALQGGQALVFALPLLLVFAIAFMALFDAGQALHLKRRLLATADASALGAATVRARALNFAAYANRAIVADEVAIAQAVTVDAWSAHFRTLTGNARALGVVPPLRAALEALHEGAVVAQQSARVAAQVEVGARSAHILALQGTQAALVNGAQTFALGAVAAEIARANDPDFFAHLLAGDAFGRFTHTLGGAERARLQDVVMRSLDPFTGQSRARDIRLPLPSGCVLSFSRDSFMHLRRRGATVLAADLSRWEAQDTLSLHDARSRGGFLGLGGRCSEQELLALGQGATVAGDGELSHVGHDVLRNARARATSVPAERLAGYRGLAVVRDIDHDALADPRDVRVGLAVLARAESPAFRGAQAGGLAAGRLLPRHAFHGGRLWALSSAEVAFRRREPASGPERVEYGSLFSPYFHAKLVAPSALQVAEAWARAR